MTIMRRHSRRNFGPKHYSFCFLTALFLCLCAGCVTAPVGREYDLGFIASRDTDLNGSSRFRAAGPFIERQTATDGATFRAFRPFYNTVRLPAEEKAVTEFLWPLGMAKEFHGQTQWRFFPSYGDDFDMDQKGSRNRFVILPIVFAGKDKHDERYFAIFPIGGKINEFLMQDTIKFVLFPLYSYSSVKDVRTHNVLWPIVSWSYGGGISRQRVFPLYMRSVVDDQWAKHSVLWPVWNRVKYTDPRNPGGGFMLFPIVGRAKVSHLDDAGEARADDSVTWWVVPPLFKWARGPEHLAVNCPWPIVQYSRGETDKLYIWPLWGKKSTEGTDYSFLLWPIVRRHRIDRGNTVIKRFSIFPIVSHDTKVANAPAEQQEGEDIDPEVLSRHFRLWPLLSYKRDEDASITRVPSLWPTRRLRSVEKNFAPLWTLYSREKVGASVDHEVLWGLFRRRKEDSGAGRISLFPLFSNEKGGEDEQKRHWKFLMGLIGYKREGLQKQYQLLYFLRFKTGDEQ
jgi:hypothetical protein